MISAYKSSSSKQRVQKEKMIFLNLLLTVSSLPTEQHSDRLYHSMNNKTPSRTDFDQRFVRYYQLLSVESYFNHQ